QDNREASSSNQGLLSEAPGATNTTGVQNYATKLITPALDLDSASSATLSFWHAQEVWAGDQDELKVYYRTSPTGAWTQLAHYTASIADWTQETLILPYLSSSYQIAFEGITAYGYGVCLDKVVVSVNDPVTVDWLTVNGGNSHSGSINSGAADQNISIGFNSAGLGEGIYSSHLTVLSNDPQNPSFNIPVQLTVTGGSLDIPQATIATTGPNTVRISWNQVSGASSYQIWSCAEPYGTYTLLGTTPDLYWDHNVSAQQMRFYKVIASSQFSKSGVKN
ncbi:MAG: choice-of-anchor J domain-containing protein, partial [Candidatus Syntrophosphaera sp.]